ncbi:flavin reductase [Rhizobium sp. DKSPLA3]|uniref:Flavin reductase n=2 Tax=Rhizobium quercicola TaxID=2901226 RepID=A0A9X1SZG3_9HYPH|nr:flavin reductase [Rhizobium quercicola]MCD7107530.1 flavin reductase [Rhizobium quercicola]
MRRAAFRSAMAKLGAAVNIITTDGPGGRTGFAATAVCSVTDDPPTLLVCLNRSASVYDAVTTNRALCVNTLSAGHQTLSQLFGGKTPAAERFATADWSVLTTGAPALDDALVSFDCVIENTVSQGTHDVLFCRVVSTATRTEGPALFYFDRAYHAVSG